MEPTLPEQFRTWNIGNPSAKGDWTKHHPWRAPGYAPVADPCGMAGGYSHEGVGGGDTPNGANHFDRGSELPKHNVSRFAGFAREMCHFFLLFPTFSILFPYFFILVHTFSLEITKINKKTLVRGGEGNGGTGGWG